MCGQILKVGNRNILCTHLVFNTIYIYLADKSIVLQVIKENIIVSPRACALNLSGEGTSEQRNGSWCG